MSGVVDTSRLGRPAAELIGSEDFVRSTYESGGHAAMSLADGPGGVTNAVRR